jgi:hypothetical protein
MLSLEGRKSAKMGGLTYLYDFKNITLVIKPQAKGLPNIIAIFLLSTIPKNTETAGCTRLKYDEYHGCRLILAKFQK